MLVEVSFQKSRMEGLHLLMDCSKHEGADGFRETSFFHLFGCKYV